MTLTVPAAPPAGQGTMVEARGVVKRYPVRGGEPFTAVAGVDFSLRRGECFGVLGPNGAGKSTMMRMISCVAEPSEGSLSVLGLPTADSGPRIRARIGVVPQDDALDRELTVRENLLVYGKYFGIPRAELRARATHASPSPRSACSPPPTYATGKTSRQSNSYCSQCSSSRPPSTRSASTPEPSRPWSAAYRSTTPSTCCETPS